MDAYGMLKSLVSVEKLPQKHPLSSTPDVNTVESDSQHEITSCLTNH